MCEHWLYCCSRYWIIKGSWYPYWEKQTEPTKRQKINKLPNVNIYILAYLRLSTLNQSWNSISSKWSLCSGLLFRQPRMKWQHSVQKMSVLPTTSHLLCKLGKIPAISIRPSFIKPLSFLLCRNDILTIWEAWLEPDMSVHQADIAAVREKAGDHGEQQHA